MFYYVSFRRMCPYVRLLAFAVLMTKLIDNTPAEPTHTTGECFRSKTKCLIDSAEGSGTQWKSCNLRYVTKFTRTLVARTQMTRTRS